MKSLLQPQLCEVASLQNLLPRIVGEFGEVIEILEAHCDFALTEVLNKAQNIVPSSLQSGHGFASRTSSNFLSYFVGEYFYVPVAKSADDFCCQFGWKIIDLDQTQSPKCSALNAPHPIGARVQNNDSFHTILRASNHRIGGAVALRSPHQPLC